MHIRIYMYTYICKSKTWDIYLNFLGHFLYGVYANCLALAILTLEVSQPTPFKKESRPEIQKAKCGKCVYSLLAKSKGRYDHQLRNARAYFSYHVALWSRFCSSNIFPIYPLLFLLLRLLNLVQLFWVLSFATNSKKFDTFGHTRPWMMPFSDLPENSAEN